MYDEKLLLQMLDLSIKAMNENELCSYCKFHNNCRAKHSDWICESGLFDGLKEMVSKNV